MDEHSFRAVEEGEHNWPPSGGAIGKIYAGIQRKDLLHLALLLHDVGKGRDEDHSAVGAILAEAAGIQLGYTDEERARCWFFSSGAI
ncbi:MAG: HD domain-containing protein [Candidatus Manganitrophus sp.]|nr:HD domain-containing protein [Candidatus Manganitrophus sp.]